MPSGVPRWDGPLLTMNEGDPMSATAIALTRFGLGARPDEPAPADPPRWLLAQLDRFEPRPTALASVPVRSVVAARLGDYLEQLRRLRRSIGGEMNAMRRTGMAATTPGTTGDPNDQLAGLPQEVRRYIRQEARTAYLAAVAGRMNAALTTPAPFAERLVHFWANHFAVSIDKLPVIGLGGLLEMEAIRPNILGRYSDLLLAVEQHPAMLLYLDQAQSIGPNSRAGTLLKNRRRGANRAGGLNENLAREILELHTLGVNGGYGQADVGELARALTGWTVSGLARGSGARLAGLGGEPGAFRFSPMIHEPGARTILGRRYDQEGEAQGRAILADLAAHPATATHLATKLARHFAGDEPPPALVSRLAETYRRTGGDLAALYRVLVEAPETWAAGPVKFKTPWDWSVSALRAVGTRALEGEAAAGLLNQLGQPVWRPGSPAGWDDSAPSWAGPDALVRRVEAAERIAGRTSGAIDARALAQRIFPGTLTPATAEAISRAESPGQGLALLLVAPEFLRR